MRNLKFEEFFSKHWRNYDYYSPLPYNFKFEIDHRSEERLTQADKRNIAEISERALKGEIGQGGLAWRITEIYNSPGFSIGPSIFINKDKLPALRLKIIQENKYDLAFHGSTVSALLQKSYIEHEADWHGLWQTFSPASLERVIYPHEVYINRVISGAEFGITKTIIPKTAEVLPLLNHYMALRFKWAAEFFFEDQELASAASEELGRLLLNGVKASEYHREAFLLALIDEFWPDFLTRNLFTRVALINMIYVFQGLGEKEIINNMKVITQDAERCSRLKNALKNYDIVEACEILGVDVNVWKRRIENIIKCMIQNLDFRPSILRLRMFLKLIEEIPKKDAVKRTLNLVSPLARAIVYIIYDGDNIYICSAFRPFSEDYIGSSLSFLTDIEIANRVRDVKPSQRLKVLENMRCPLENNEYWRCDGGGNDCRHIAPWIQHMADRS